jgi:hypothetical protein
MSVDVLIEQANPTDASVEVAAETGVDNNIPDTTGPAENPQTAAEEKPEAPSANKKKAAKASTAKKTRTVELTLTVTGTADGEWQAELKHGSKWVARGLEIPASAVSRAARELHIELATPIDEVINAARELQEAKVAQLEAELEQAKQILAELDQ